MPASAPAWASVRRYLGTWTACGGWPGRRRATSQRSRAATVTPFSGGAGLVAPPGEECALKQGRQAAIGFLV
ncbi:hypothetical protein [Massilia sp. BSC265]|uniref:hypothetical protein n=1 Tax=Massilia sp. BSC265 TaxID=1549812 RepID=UPI0004E97977|nr:hypothetical protein [Massilia sp. BSC265]KFI08312.1 hypothetical protein JN27_05800 [Massilia sp. BSC265]